MQETPADRLAAGRWSSGCSGGTDLRAARRGRGAGQRPHLRRRGLRRLPHPDGPGARPTTWPRELPEATRGAAGPQGAVPQHQPHPGARRPASTRCCTRSQPAAAARRPPRRRGACATPSARKDMAARRADLRRASPQRRAPRTPSTTCCTPSRTTPRSTASSCPYRAWDLLDLDRPGAGPHAAAAVGALLRREPSAWQRSAESDEPRTVLPKLLDQYQPARPRRRHAAPRTTPGSSDEPDDLRRRRPSRPPRPRPRPWPRASPPTPSARRSRWPPTSSSCATPAGPRRARPARQADRQRPRRLDRRPRLRLGQRLAQHGPRRQRPQHLRLPDPRRLPGRPRPRQPRRRLPRTGSRCPLAEAPRRASQSTEPDALLREADDGHPRQPPGPRRALVHRYGELGHAAAAVFDLLLRYAISEDGALHAEKYYRTVTRGVRRDPPGVPLAAARRPGPRHRQRVRPPRPGLRRGLPAAQGLSGRPAREDCRSPHGRAWMSVPLPRPSPLKSGGGGPARAMATPSPTSPLHIGKLTHGRAEACCVPTRNAVLNR